MQRFLLLEDDKIQRQIIQMYFTKFTTIEPVPIEPEQLLAYLTPAGARAVIVMDWRISGTKNGATIVEEIRRMAPGSVIVVYSASIDTRDREAAKCRVDGFLVKNGNIRELQNFIEGYINDYEG